MWRIILDVLFWWRRWYWRRSAPIVLDVRALILHQGRVLLIRHRYGDRRSWYFPGGAVRRRETLTVALCREVKEELNASIHLERWHGLYHHFSHGASGHVAVFVASLEDPGQLRPNWEVATFGFFDPEALPSQTSPATRRRIEECLDQDWRFEYCAW